MRRGSPSDATESAEKRVAGGAAAASLRAVSVAQLLAERAPRSIVPVMCRESVATAAQRLADAGVLSAPVLLPPALGDDDAESGGLAQEGDAYLGMFDVLNLLHSIVKEFADDVHRTELSTVQRWQLLEKHAKKFMARSVYSISDSAHTEFLWKGDQSMSLHDVVSSRFLHASERQRHVHRVAVFNARGEVEAILSQSDIVRYMHKHPELLGGLADMTIDELDLGTTSVFSVQGSALAIDAFEEMLRKNTTGLAVLHGSQLVSNISASDLRGLTVDNLENLSKSVEHFLLNGLSKAKTHARLPAPVTVSGDSTLRQVVDQLVKHGVHRTYVTSVDRQVERVITLSDVLAAVVRAEHIVDEQRRSSN